MAQKRKKKPQDLTREFLDMVDPSSVVREDDMGRIGSVVGGLKDVQAMVDPSSLVREDEMGRIGSVVGGLKDVLDQISTPRKKEAQRGLSGQMDVQAILDQISTPRKKEAPRGTGGVQAIIEEILKGRRRQ